MVLARDMAFARREVQRWDVVGSITILQLDGPSASCQRNQLMAKADPHDRNLRRLHHFTKVVYRILTMGGISGAVADEDAIEAMNLLAFCPCCGESNGMRAAY